MKKVFWFLFMIFLLFAAPVVFAQSEIPPIQVGEVSAVNVIAWVAAGLALFFDYFPGVAAKFDALDATTKKYWMVGIAIGVVTVLFGLTCAQVTSTSLTCTTTGAYSAITGVIYLIIVQYGVVNAPDGFCKCGLMLGLMPVTDYIFPSVVRAEHALAHLAKFLKERDIEFDLRKYSIVQLVRNDRILQYR